MNSKDVFGNADAAYEALKEKIKAQMPKDIAGINVDKIEVNLTVVMTDGGRYTPKNEIEAITVEDEDRKEFKRLTGISANRHDRQLLSKLFADPELPLHPRSVAALIKDQIVTIENGKTKTSDTNAAVLFWIGCGICLVMLALLFLVLFAATAQPVKANPTQFLGATLLIGILTYIWWSMCIPHLRLKRLKPALHRIYGE